MKFIWWVKLLKRRCLISVVHMAVPIKEVKEHN